MILIAPMDLSQSFGVPGQPQHSVVQVAMQRIVDVVQSEVALGVVVGNAKATRQWRERSATYIGIPLNPC